MMTRAIFFKSLLTVFGLGQSQKTGSAQMCGSSTGLAIQCECKEDEEHCPLGHCQKPAIFGVAPDYMMNGTAVFGTVETSIPLRGCSVCGIVYVKR